MDEQHLRLQLEALERRVDQRWRRRLFGGLVVAAILAVAPMAALASHTFSDVPSGHTFHTDVANVANAGISSGCSATKYCPDANVTRGQMAAFLARTGGRVDYAEGSVLNVAPSKDIGQVTIRASNVPGGTAYVKLDASFVAYPRNGNETGCNPCRVHGLINEVGTPNYSLSTDVTFFNLSTGYQEYASGSITWVVRIPTATDVTFRLLVERLDGTGTVDARGSITATYIPFDGAGSNTLIPPP